MVAPGLGAAADVVTIRGGARRRAALAAALVALLVAPALAEEGAAGRLPGDEIWTADEAGRAALFEAVAGRVEALYWDPDHLDWRAWRGRHRDAVVRADDPSALDRAFRRMFADLDDDHSRWIGRGAAGEAAPAPRAPPFEGPEEAPDERPDPRDGGPAEGAPGEGPGPAPRDAPTEPPDPPDVPTGDAELGAATRSIAAGGLVVTRVHPGGAADIGGLRRGDVIVSTDADGAAGSSFGLRARIRAALREGAAHLTVLRGDERRTVRLEPRPLPPGAAARPLVERTPDLNAARLEIPTFEVGTARAVHDELARLREAGVDALVLDVRGNPGGGVIEMGLVLGAFLEGTPLRSFGRGASGWSLTIRRQGALEVRLVRDAGTRTGRDVAAGRFAAFTSWEAPVAVLVDGGTASAAEAFAGALADAGAPVVGERTPGNVETIRRISLPGGHTAMIATGDLRRPDGRPLAPLAPDVGATLDAAELARGLDAPYAEALRRLRGLPIVPGRWF